MDEPAIIMVITCECGAYIVSVKAPVVLGDDIHCPKHYLHVPSNGWSWTIEAHVAGRAVIPLPIGG